MKKIIHIISISLILSGCTGINTYKDEWKTKIDPSVNSQEQLEIDHNLCSELAFKAIEKMRTETAIRTGIGAVTGAIVGVGISTILGKNAGTKIGKQAAGLGALYGAGAGLTSTKNHANEIYGNCMINRKYLLLW